LSPIWGQDSRNQQINIAPRRRALLVAAGGFAGSEGASLGGAAESSTCVAVAESEAGISSVPLASVATGSSSGGAAASRVSSSQCAQPAAKSCVRRRAVGVFDRRVGDRPLVAGVDAVLGAAADFGSALMSLLACAPASAAKNSAAAAATAFR
jgi:hypothetical protein